MDVNNGVMYAFVALIALNYIVPRVDAVRRQPLLFWAINGLTAIAAVAMFAGVPGYTGHPLVPPMIGLVLLMHVALNAAARTRWLSEERQERLAEELAARRAVEDEG